MELADRLPFCPRCTYPFTGLPEAHQCPECGLAYDVESRMWTAVASRWGTRRTIHLCVGVVATFFGLLQIVGTFVWTQPQVTRIGHFAFGLLLLVVARFFLRAWKLDQGPQSRFMAIMPDGIWYVDSLMGRNNIPWNQVRSIERESAYVDTAFRVLLIPNGHITISRDLVSYKDAQEVISQIWLRIEKVTP